MARKPAKKTTARKPSRVAAKSSKRKVAKAGKAKAAKTRKAKTKPTKTKKAKAGAARKVAKKSAAKSARGPSKKSTVKARAPRANPAPAAKSVHPPQRVAVSHYNNADFESGLRTYAQYRDLGFAAATDGLAQAHVIRFVPP
ncbi:MAG: hypothetical protein J0H75_16075, partial [Rhizobiales bacterium]|nr:hypothetical protein [Hyphomicrobiales bacterium]